MVSADILPFKIPRVKRGESRLIYIAAPFDQRDRAKRVKEQLEAAGHVTTSTWISSHLDNLDELDSESAMHEANHDAEGVLRSEIMVFLNGESTSGGMHVEMGIAIAASKSILLVGPRTSIFHHLPNVKQIDADADIVDRINRLFPRTQKGPQP